MKSLLRLRPYLTKYKGTLLWGVCTVIISNLFVVATPLFIGNAVDTIKHGIEAGVIQYSKLLRDAGLIVGFALVAGFMTFLTRQTIIVVSRKIEYDLRNDFLAHIQKLPLSYFQNTPTGDLMAHATNDISAVRNVLGPGIMYPSDTFMTFSMALTLMFVKDWSLTLVALVPLPLISYAVYKLGKIIHAKFNERQEQYLASHDSRAGKSFGYPGGQSIRAGRVRDRALRKIKLGISEKKSRPGESAIDHVADDVYAGRFLFGHHGVFWRLAGHCREDFYRNVDGVFHVSLDVDMADDRVRMGDEHHSTGRSVDGKTCENIRHSTRKSGIRKKRIS